jgi:hypothetical protein
MIGVNHMRRRCDNLDSINKSFWTLDSRFRHLDAKTARCGQHRAVNEGQERKVFEVNRATAGN